MIFPICHLTLMRGTLQLDRYLDRHSAPRVQDPIKTTANGEHSGYTVGTALLHFFHTLYVLSFCKGSTGSRVTRISSLTEGSGHIVPLTSKEG